MLCWALPEIPEHRAQCIPWMNTVGYVPQTKMKPKILISVIFYILFLPLGLSSCALGLFLVTFSSAVLETLKREDITVPRAQTRLLPARCEVQFCGLNPWPLPYRGNLIYLPNVRKRKPGPGEYVCLQRGIVYVMTGITVLSFARHVCRNRNLQLWLCQDPI